MADKSHHLHRQRSRDAIPRAPTWATRAPTVAIKERQLQRRRRLQRRQHLSAFVLSVLTSPCLFSTSEQPEKLSRGDGPFT